MREKSAKTDFEVFLLRHYAFFMDQATEVVERMKKAGSTDYCLRQAQNGMLCHGDFQHHNILFTSGQMMIVNYEKCMQDIQIRDFYLFFRKIMDPRKEQGKAGNPSCTGAGKTECPERTGKNVFSCVKHVRSCEKLP